jgi:hypothetical protein
MKNTVISTIIFIFTLNSSQSFSQGAAAISLKFHERVGLFIDYCKQFEKKDLFTQVRSDMRSWDKIANKNGLKYYFLKSDQLTVSYKTNEDQKQEKSIWLGIGLSTILPGAGEFYGKSYVKSAIFLGIEIASWVMVFYYNHKGNVGTDQFQDFARANWSVRRWAQWLVNQGFQGAGAINPNEPNLETLRAEINQCASQNFSHTLAEYYTQDYFEVIGKYQEFQAGWTGADQILTKDNYQTVHTLIDENYTYMRKSTNDYYDHSTIASGITILNHLLSMGDAAWTIAMYNKNIKVQSGFRMGTYLTKFTYQEKPLPTFNLKFSF